MPKMKCHYEVLGLQRNADDAEIKQAYRKMALKWHPDKNLSSPDAAKDQFQLVQQAYEVLSDAHERAWYDNHREQILRGGHSDYEDESLDVFQYFSVSCYKGYTDDAAGFYAVYREVFRKIATEDIEYREEGEFEDVPEFGTSTSSYEEIVGPFYAYWQSYCTKKSYAWLCPHNIAEIRDRRVLKVIEKESKKIQQKARKERNEAVRNLVSFVKKRDKRVQAYKKFLEERTQMNRAKHEQVRLEQIRKRRQELEEQCLNNSTVDEGYEQQLRQLENAYASDHSDEEDDDEDEIEDEDENEEDDAEDANEEEAFETDDLYCVACNKSFKTYSARENHDSSKKHKENLDRLIEKMKHEDENYKETDDSNHDDTPIESEDIEISEDEEKPEVSKKSKNKKKNKNKSAPIPHEVDTPVEKEEEAEPIVLTRISESDNNWADTSTKKNKKARNKTTKQQNKSKDPVPPQPDENKPNNPSQRQNEKPKPKAKKVVAPPIIDPEDLVDVDVDHSCVTCHATFDSKNKLFAHLKKTNHGVYIPKVAQRATDEGKASGGKKNRKK